MNTLSNLDDDQLFDLLYISKLYTEEELIHKLLKYKTAHNILNAHLPRPQELRKLIALTKHIHTYLKGFYSTMPELRKAFKILSHNYTLFKNTPLFSLLRNTINGEYDQRIHVEIQNKLYNDMHIQFLLDDHDSFYDLIAFLCGHIIHSCNTHLSCNIDNSYLVLNFI